MEYYSAIKNEIVAVFLRWRAHIPFSVLRLEYGALRPHTPCPSLQGAALMPHWGLGAGFLLPPGPQITRPTPMSSVSAPHDFLRRPTLSVPPLEPHFCPFYLTSVSFRALVPHLTSYKHSY